MMSAQAFVALRVKLFVRAFAIIIVVCCDRVVVFHFSTQLLESGALGTQHCLLDHQDNPIHHHHPLGLSHPLSHQLGLRIYIFRNRRIDLLEISLVLHCIWTEGLKLIGDATCYMSCRYQQITCAEGLPYKLYMCY